MRAQSTISSIADIPEKIKEDMKMDVKDILSNVHEEIQNYRKNLFYMKNKIDDLQEKVKIWEYIQMAEIAEKKDENGKAVYSNDVKRQAELERRKTESAEYQKLISSLKSEKYEYDLSIIILQGMLDKQENARALARMEVV